MSKVDSATVTDIYQQVPLPLDLSEAINWNCIYPGSNAQVISELRDFLVNSETIFYLAGSSGSGKTLLLQTSCQDFLQRGDKACVFSVAEDHITPVMLDNLEQFDLVCLDNLQAVAGIKAWELALFNLFNAVQAKGGKLLLSATELPTKLGIELPDLLSRLQWGHICQLKFFSEQDLMLNLQQLAELSGLELPTEVAQFLLTRLPRDIESLHAAFAKINRASYASQRRLTVPFVKLVLFEDK